MTQADPSIPKLSKAERLPAPSWVQPVPMSSQKFAQAIANSCWSHAEHLTHLDPLRISALQVSCCRVSSASMPPWRQATCPGNALRCNARTWPVTSRVSREFGFVWESSDLSQRRNYNELQQNHLQMGSAGTEPWLYPTSSRSTRGT